MVTSAQIVTSARIRAGRGLTKGTKGIPATRASVSVVTMIESDRVVPRTRTLAAVKGVLAGEGIRFIADEADGFGMRLRPRTEPAA